MSGHEGRRARYRRAIDSVGARRREIADALEGAVVDVADAEQSELKTDIRLLRGRRERLTTERDKARAERDEALDTIERVKALVDEAYRARAYPVVGVHALRYALNADPEPDLPDGFGDFLGQASGHCA